MSAMLCASLTQAHLGDLIIDLCTAPGGKTFYISEVLELQSIMSEKSNTRIVANDLYPNKIKLIKENAQRLGFYNIEYFSSDA